jgi:3-deoxy-D-manno-octulosonic-acid transferase
MAILIYQLLGACALLLVLLALPFVPAWRRGFAERLGAGGKPRAGGGELIWVHAASVGEVRAAAPLVAGLLAARPHAAVLLSTFTASGRRVAGELLRSAGPRVRVTLLPLDLGPIPGRVIRRERPALFILLETELWPVLLTALRRARVPVLLANGRISPRSFGRYRLLRGALRPVLDAVTLALVRTPADADRYRALGLPAARVQVAGNLKHAVSRRSGAEAREEAIRARLGADAGRPVLVAGSLRGPEGALVLACFRRLLARLPDLLLVLAPRHPGRFDLAALAEWSGSWVRWSEAPPRVPRAVAVVLLDTLGELADVYGAGRVACVGGTWAPVGGHNLLEPAYLGVPVVFGPDFRSFEEEGRALLAAGGGFVAATGEELHERCLRLLTDPAEREEAGRRAAAVAATFGGAAERVLATAEGLLGPGGRA